MLEMAEFVCRDCAVVSELSASRRKFLLEKGCNRLPLFCDNCFSARLKQIWEIPGEKRTAICAECGCETKLHFVPCQERPVYCPACHKKNSQSI